MRYLTDEQMARLVELAEHQTPAAIARVIGAPYFTVHKAVQRVRSRGWATPICLRDCVVCGRGAHEHRLALQDDHELLFRRDRC